MGRSSVGYAALGLANSEPIPSDRLLSDTDLAAMDTVAARQDCRSMGILQR